MAQPTFSLPDAEELMREFQGVFACLDELPSPVIGALLTAHRACRRRGGQVTIRYASRRALDQLRRTGLWHVFQIESATTRPAPSRARRTVR